MNRLRNALGQWGCVAALGVWLALSLALGGLSAYSVYTHNPSWNEAARIAVTAASGITASIATALVTPFLALFFFFREDPEGGEKLR